VSDPVAVTDWALRLVEGDTLADKLWAPQVVDAPTAGARRSVRVPERPGRPAGLCLDDPRPRPPSPRARDLQRVDGRGRVLHGFANHELLALELMATMLLRFPDAPRGWRLGLVQTMRDEQRHLRLYLDRMAACGVEAGEVPVSSFFWDTLRDAPDPLAFTCAMGLGFEQANLDFACIWQGRFAAAGDAATAEVLAQVYADEVRHLRHGVRWYRELAGQDVAFGAWEAQLSFPMSAARARGPQRDREGRRRAGLSPAYIDALEVAGASRGRPPVVYQVRVGVEDEVAGRRPGRAARAVATDLQHLPLLISKVSDVVIAQPPSVSFLQGLRAAGLTPGRVVSAVGSVAAPVIEALQPWGWSPAATAELAPLTSRVQRGPKGYEPGWAALFAKTLAARWQPWATVAHTVDEARAAVCGDRFVVKAPLSAAGTRRLVDRFDPATVQRWIDQDGAVVVQPWFDRVVDLSVHGVVDDEVPQAEGVVRFATSSRGVFRGVWLGPWLHGLPGELHRFAHDEGRRPGHVEQQLRSAWSEVAVEAQRRGYRGPLGVDAMVVRRGGRLALCPVVEANPRWTMGRVGWLLRQRLATGARGWWRFHRVKALGDPVAWAADQAAAHPVTTKDGRLASGFVPTTEPAAARALITALHVDGAEGERGATSMGEARPGDERGATAR